MTLPRNFPERKRQRQIGAARRAGDHERLEALVALGSQRDVRTKKALATGSPDRIARHRGKLGRQRA